MYKTTYSTNGVFIFASARELYMAATGAIAALKKRKKRKRNKGNKEEEKKS